MTNGNQESLVEHQSDHESSTGDNSESSCARRFGGGILIIPRQEQSLSAEDYQEIFHSRRATRQDLLRRSRGVELDDLAPRFTDVTIREYPITLGDNPGGKTVGPPLTIGWKPCSTRTVDLRAYEKQRRKEIRHKDQLIINPKDRKAMLRRVGCSQQDIIQAKADVKLARKQREESNVGQIFGRESLCEFGETLSNMLGSMTARKRAERKLLKRFQSHGEDYIKTSPCA